MTEAQLCTGECYAGGTGCDRDETQAFKYYKLAADKGQTESQFMIGKFYGVGIGVAGLGLGGWRVADLGVEVEVEVGKSASSACLC